MNKELEDFLKKNECTTKIENIFGVDVDVVYSKDGNWVSQQVIDSCMRSTIDKKIKREIL